MDEYGVLSGYEDGLGEDDEQGSRAVPSRTSLGGEAAFIEKYPCYGGFRWGIRNFAYRCRLTIPQIEIMSADIPHTLYKGGGGRKGKVTQADVDEAERLTREAAERKRKKAFTVEEVFNGDADIGLEDNKQ